MTQVDFHLIAQADAAARHQFACQWIAHRYSQPNDFKKLFILVPNEIEAEFIDDLLWTFDDISFLPHQRLRAQEIPAVQTKIVISEQEFPLDGFNYLINLHVSPPTLEQYQHIVEIVPNDDAWKQAARQHFRAYKALGYQVESVQG